MILKFNKWTSLATLAACALTGCGGGGGHASVQSSSTATSASETQSGGFYAPSYGTAESSAYSADLTSITNVVVAHQSDGQAAISLLSAMFPVVNGLVTVYGDTKVQLVSLSRNVCPSGLEGCGTTDSSELGVGNNALISGLSGLQSSVKNQGQRGTCVAFAFNAGIELLTRRSGSSSDAFSEQNTYFQGKRLTDSWDSAGLSPYSTMSAFVNQGIRFVSSSNWPYNSEDYSSTSDVCADYWSVYGRSFTCSNTEAQGGGSDHHAQDPSAASASGVSVQTAHQLYAAVGRVKQALYRGYPVVLAINANYDFMLATEKYGVVSWVIKADSCGSNLCGHEVMAVGYQDDSRVDGGGYVIVKNSWGQSWGDGGLAYLTYAWLAHSLLDAQAIVSVQ